MTDNHYRYDLLDALRKHLTSMNVHAARGVRDETELDRRQFKTLHDENPDYVTVLLTDDGIIAVTDCYESEDFAWTGRLDDQDVFDDLVHDGVLVEEN